MARSLSVSRRITFQRSFVKRFRMVVLKAMGEAFYVPIFAKRALLQAFSNPGYGYPYRRALSR
jgi:hypothetical protein